MTACFLSNISAKYYINPSMLSRVIAKNVRDVFFLRHSVVQPRIVQFRSNLVCIHVVRSRDSNANVQGHSVKDEGHSVTLRIDSKNVIRHVWISWESSNFVKIITIQSASC